MKNKTRLWQEFSACGELLGRKPETDLEIVEVSSGISPKLRDDAGLLVDDGWYFNFLIHVKPRDEPA
jgi:hypothetical protein